MTRNPGRMENIPNKHLGIFLTSEIPGSRSIELGLSKAVRIWSKKNLKVYILGERVLLIHAFWPKEIIIAGGKVSITVFHGDILMNCKRCGKSYSA